MMPYGHVCGSWFWFFPIIMIGFFIFMGIMFCRGCGPRWGHRRELHETALDILKKRYAGGEITKEEFERMKHEILS